MFSTKNPWHVCFSVSLAWGHLANLDFRLTEAVTEFLKRATAFGLIALPNFILSADPMQSVTIGECVSNLQQHPTSDEIPDSLERIKNCEKDGLERFLGPPRVPYMGSWNSVALFMVALIFSTGTS